MLHFINTIISYSLADKSLSKNIKQKAPTANILLPKYISHEAPSASLDKTDTEFALTLYKESNTVVSKIQVYSFLYNATCFKYKAAISRK